nr:hypothetical protein [Gammaproteobacteria bacterium]
LEDIDRYILTLNLKELSPEQQTRARNRLRMQDYWVPLFKKHEYDRLTLELGSYLAKNIIDLRYREVESLTSREELIEHLKLLDTALIMADLHDDYKSYDQSKITVNIKILNDNLTSGYMPDSVRSGIACRVS